MFPTRRLLAILLLAGLAKAQYFDARNNAMGGTGVASSRYTVAGFANPALLTRHEEGDTWGLVLPSVGVLVSDPDDLIKQIDDFVDEVDRISTLLDSGGATPGDLIGLTQRLLDLDGKRATGNTGGGFAFAMPGKELGWSIFVNTYGDARVAVVVDPADIPVILTASNSADLDNLATEARVLGFSTTDVGVSFAHEIDIAGMALSVGISPKFQRIDTYNYSVNVDNYDFDDFRDSQYRSDSGHFNLDLGASFSPLPILTVGLMARNVIEQDATTEVVNGQAFDVSIVPTLTAGVALRLGGLTLAADADALEFERFAVDVDSGSRFLRAGAEYDFGGHFQLRAGGQYDMEDTVETMFTAGLGISPGRYFHLDLAGMSDFDNSYGAVVEFGFTF